MIWYILTFIAGWASCWYLSKFLLKNVLRRNDSLIVEVLSGLPQEKLLNVSRILNEEIEKRRGGTVASGPTVHYQETERP